MHSIILFVLMMAVEWLKNTANKIENYLNRLRHESLLASLNHTTLSSLSHHIYVYKELVTQWLTNYSELLITSRKQSSEETGNGQLNQTNLVLSSNRDRICNLWILTIYISRYYHKEKEQNKQDLTLTTSSSSSSSECRGHSIKGRCDFFSPWTGQFLVVVPVV